MLDRLLVTGLLALAAAGPAMAQRQAPMDPRLSALLAKAMAQSGVIVTLAGGDSPYAASISAVNGRSVCAPSAERDVRRFQDAADHQPGIHMNFSYYQVSRTLPNGKRTVLDGNLLRTRNPGQFTMCQNLAIDIYPR